jgi:hypothetical protein
MAKSKAASRNKRPTARRATGPRAGADSRARVGKGEGLEVGNARRESGATGPLPRRAATSTRRNAPLQLPGEKAVKPTQQTVPVAPPRRAPGDDQPMPQAVVDRRRQVIGTDDKPRRR